MTAKSAMDNLPEKNTSLADTSSQERQTLPDTRTQVIFHNSIFDAGFLTEKNIYFLVFVSIAMLITGTITFIRRRQQKNQQHRKEQEYLRYFHSILPHSQIYGNLNDIFSKPNRGKNSSKKASMKNKRLTPTEHVRRVSVTSVSSAVSGILKRFQYQHPTKKTVSQEGDDEDECKSIEELDEEMDIEPSICEAEATVHSVLNDKFHYTVTDIEDIKIDKTKTAENVCQKFYFPMENRTGAINNTTNDKKHEPSSPRVRFSTENDEIMQDKDRIRKGQTCTVADIENGKSDIAEGGKSEKGSVENGKVIHKRNGFINLMQRISDRNAEQQSMHVQKPPEIVDTHYTNETNRQEKNVIATSTELSKRDSENSMQCCDNSNKVLLDPIRKSTSFQQMQRCARDKEMISKKYEFMFEDTDDMQVTVL